jgi:methionyl-tRNA formyltransferase
MVQSIVFAGTPHNAARTLGDIVAAGIEVSLVITRPDAPKGRKGVLTASPVASMAELLGLKVHKSHSIDAATISAIQATPAQVGIIVAYGSILKADALVAVKHGWYNVHYSLLPQLRGAAPVQHAIIRGLSETGATLFKLDSGVDTGGYISQVRTKIEPGETASRLLERLTGLGVSLIVQDLPSIFAGTSVEVRQEGASSIAPKLHRDDAKLIFSKGARELEGIVLGCNPEPGAWASIGPQQIKVHDAFAVDLDEGREPGLVFTHGKNIAVACGENSALVLREVQPAGKQSMQASDWFRGKTGEVRLS